MRQILATPQTDPLTVLVDIAGDPTKPDDLRVEAAKSACPYMYPRLSAAVVATAPMPEKDAGASIVERLLGRLSRMTPTVTIEAVAEPTLAGAD